MVLQQIDFGENPVPTKPGEFSPRSLERIMNLQKKQQEKH